MPLIAQRAGSLEQVESFSIDPIDWKKMKKEPLGSYVIDGTQWPAVLKTSIKGTQFFAYAPGFTGIKPEPESEDHIRTKAEIVKALRAAGYKAWVECAGNREDNQLWKADVLCQTADRKIAFEVQLSDQTLQEYMRRSDRYLDDGIECVWLVKAPKNFKKLQKAIYYLLKSADVEMETCIRPALEEVKASPFIPYSLERYEGKTGVMVFEGRTPKLLTVGEYAVGVAKGCLKFGTFILRFDNDLAVNSEPTWLWSIQDK